MFARKPIVAVVMRMVEGHILVRVGIWPLRANSVYDVYVIAARHWLKGVAVYSWGTGSGYRYSPMIAILFMRA